MNMDATTSTEASHNTSYHTRPEGRRFVRNPAAGAVQHVLLRVVMAPLWAAISWKSYLPKLYAGRRPADFAEYRDQIVATLRKPGHARAFSLTTRTSHAPAEAQTQTAEETSWAGETGSPHAETQHCGTDAASGTADSASAYGAARPDGTVTGTPRRWLRLEGAVLLAGSLIAYSATGQHWWLIPLVLLIPDVVMIGYLRGNHLGAQLYNLTHSTVLPAAVIGFGWWQSKPLVVAVGLIWLAHVGFDRLLGYGLKYDDHFQHTHLGHLGPPGPDQQEPAQLGELTLR